ncbi:exo 1,3/1,4-beta-D-glucan glucohydrolase [Glaciecola sp. HTCC2999]|uniref:glycoside hydrolase family 3 protein n=1 Tax=Glaciecola sp. HTCC2999 TaxID=455436 RepID=UPI0000E0EF01|nr:exo 1,3/1,4-beta-D-glucan glucohydrolase [Glaciecola sp. HTCC2999]
MLNTMPRAILGTIIALSLSACGQTELEQVEAVKPSQETALEQIWPVLDIEVKKDAEIEAFVAKMLSEMTLEQKLGQMIQPEIRDITVEDMRKYGFGSFLNGGGAYPNNNKQSTPQDWIDLAEAMYQASIDDSLDGSSIPTIWGTDAVHGHNNVVGATLFPHNIGLGAANDPDLIERIAHATAKEVLATGIDWIFAPTVAVVRNDRWGRTYEGYSEDPDIVRAYSAAIVHGLQGRAGENFLAEDKVLSTVKHFVGDGGTQDGVDQGNNTSSEEELFRIHAQGYVGGLTAGSQSVMASFNRWQGDKIHGSEYLLNQVLKERMGFDGFVVGDWNGHGQVAGCANESCPQAINAGLDIFMAPTQSWRALFDNTLQQIKDGIIPMSRIDDAVTRILRVKARAGIFDRPSPAKRAFSGKMELIGHPDHRAVAREAVRKSLVLLKNNNVLPLNPTANILVAGDAAHNIGKQSGGWTITWQGTNNTNDDFPGGSSIYDGIKASVDTAGGNVTLSADGSFTDKPDVAIVVFGEEPYAEGVGDRPSVEYQPGNKTDLAILKRLKAQGIPVVSIFISGRAMWVNPELNASDAFVAAWLPGSEGNGVADVIMAKADGSVNYDFHGKLSYSWPKTPDQIVNVGDADYDPLLPYGFGLRYGDENVLTAMLDELDIDTSANASNMIYNRAVVSPWNLALVSNGTANSVMSNTVNLPNVNYRTYDRNVQEDSFQLTFTGNGPSAVLFNTANAVDLANVATDMALSMEVNVVKQPDGPVYLGMNCLSDTNCKAQVDINQVLSTLPLDTWGNVSVATSCFTKAGIDLTQITNVFALSTANSANIILSDIGFKAPSEQTMTCE